MWRALIVVAGFTSIVGCAASRSVCRVDEQPMVSRALSAPGVTSLRGEARVEQWAGRSRVRGTVYFIVEGPDKLRFDVMSQFGAIAIVTHRDGVFVFNDKQNNRVVSGPASEQSIADVLGFPLMPQRVVDLFTGKFVSSEDSSVESLACDGHAWRLTTRAGDGEREVAVLRLVETTRGPRLDAISVQRIAANGDAVWRASFGEHRDVGGDGVRIPFRIRFVDSRHGSDTELSVKQAQANVSVPVDAFESSTVGAETE